MGKLRTTTAPRIGVAPIVWTCPSCAADVTSKFARKHHVCLPVDVRKLAA